MARYIPVARITDVPPGNVRQVVIKDKPIALCNVDGEFFAICDICTHEDYFLSGGSLDGYEIECPAHATVFDVRTGEVEVPPAERPVATYPVRVVNGIVQIQID